jgi:3-oxoacyl-[acyl-carrier protein] reductase
MSTRFAGKIAVVTGGSSGIGAAIAAALAREGAIVHVVASGSFAKAEAIALAIGASGGTASPRVANIRDAAAARGLIDGIVATHGRIDVVVNAAGVFLPSPPGETEPSIADDMIDTNVKGTWNVIQAAVPHMKRGGGGKILNFSSVAAVTGFKGFALYCASKAAISMLTRVLGAELAPFDININAIAPGNTETPMNEGMRNDPDQKGILDAMQAMTPSNHTFSKPEEITAAALFLLSPEARPIHGSTLLADEGISAAIG